ncbi:MAG: lactonase family protein [Terriglobales bacterium]
MRLANRVFFSLLAIIAMLGWAGCGGGCPTTSFNTTGTSAGTAAGVTKPGTVCGPGTTGGGGNSAAFLYYLGTNDILGAGLSSSGSFAPLTSFTPPTLPSSVANDMFIVNKKFLYLPQSDSFSIQAFTIDHTTGALAAISGSPFATAGADSITSDPTGRFLFVGNDTSGQISVFQINSTTGVLTPTPGSPFSAFNLDFAHVLAVDGTGKFLYAGQGSAFLPVYGFSIDQNSGALSQITGSPFLLNVAGVRTDFTGKYAVGLSGTIGDNNLYVFAIDATTGGLAPVSGSPFATTANQLFDLRVHPSSQFVYSFGEDSSGNIAAVEGFSLDPSSGALTALTGSPFTSLPIVAGCKWDQGGGEAFCASSTGAAFSVFDTNVTTGALTKTVTDLSVTSSAVAFAPTD